MTLADPIIGTRTEHMTPIGVERMGDAADALSSPSVLRLENLDTDLLPPAEALRITGEDIRSDPANSYLPFLGQDDLRREAAALVERNGGLPAGSIDWRRQCSISAGGLSGVTNTLLALIDPGDEVVLTSPTYVGLINRVRLAGGVPRFVPLKMQDNRWSLDTAALDRVVTRRTRAFLIASPSMPSGAVLDQREWQALCEACIHANAWMIHDAAMERLLFTGVQHVNPLHFEGMQRRTITIGAASKEYRMIGWRVGWVVSPPQAAEAIARVAISNVVCPVGIAQRAVAAAMRAPNDGIAESVAIWQARHDFIVKDLGVDYAVLPAQGGWSLLVDTRPLGLTGAQASQRLLQHGVAATSMENWGLEETQHHLRLVFSNEPLDRLSGLRDRFDRAFAAANPQTCRSDAVPVRPT